MSNASFSKWAPALSERRTLSQKGLSVLKRRVRVFIGLTGSSSEAGMQNGPFNMQLANYLNVNRLSFAFLSKRKCYAK
ncbi:hypothetical protein B4901_03190 [Yersinia frederiksenii]|nr:hypothetical protein B4901_03190 [Yersinia frederiksenii]